MSPSKQHHRGRHPEDDRLFSAKYLPVLCSAVEDLSWLQSRGYSDPASLKLVGDHYQLRVRQRMAVHRSACSDASLALRRERAVSRKAIRGKAVCIDGYNLVITLESAFSGGILLWGRDGAVRDLASLHGSYRMVSETLPVILMAGASLEALGASKVHWLLDAPVSNSGRLATLLRQAAMDSGLPWEVSVLPNPDPVLAESKDIVVTSDSWILDRAARWANLALWILLDAEIAPDLLKLAPDLQKIKLHE
jgi:hypothetical protein